MRPATGGPASPVPGLQHDEDFNGMTLRDYFAAKAMVAMMGQNCSAVVAAAKSKGDEPSMFLAGAAYEMADAMLAARGAP